MAEQVGDNVSGFAPGDRLVPLSDRRGGQSGTFAEYAAVDHKLAVLVPPSIGLLEAAVIPTSGLTAYQALYRADRADAKVAMNASLAFLMTRCSA